MHPHLIAARNVNSALEDGLWFLKTTGLMDQSRNGPVMRAPGPVITTYLNPEERLVWSKRRHANPFFHLMESLWMLSGRNDLKSLLPFNSRMASYAEPSGTFHGAYGYRWRRHFGQDQLVNLVRHLTEFPSTRRAVLQMWDPSADLGANLARDLPCNTAVYFERHGERLDMTVTCRSNDVVMGAYGANAVHFSILQQVIAEALGVQMGVYHQFSNNYHLYVNEHKALMQSPPSAEAEDRYRYDVTPCVIPIVSGGFEYTLESISIFWDLDPELNVADYVDNDFLTYIAQPMRQYYLSRKAGKDQPQILGNMPVSDWKEAAIAWVNEANERKENVGK